jgi:hypothetical protein
MTVVAGRALCAILLQKERPAYEVASGKSKGFEAHWMKLQISVVIG